MRVPSAVARSQTSIGESLGRWRRLRFLTTTEVADRAGIGISTLQRLGKGRGGTVASLLRVARALGILDELTGSVDPLSTVVGRLRKEEALTERARRRAPRRQPSRWSSPT